MREAALFLGIVLLFPGACSVVLMVAFGAFNPSPMREPFRFSDVDGYEGFAALIWGASFMISFGGMLVIRHALKMKPDPPPGGAGNQRQR